MRAVTFQGPGEIRIDEKPDPEVSDPGEALVRVSATGVCGSDLHIYHGRVQIEPGFTIGHEYVGVVEAVGDDVTTVKPGDRVLGTYCTACGNCFHCRRAEFHKCDNGRVFGHGALLGDLQGTQADLTLIPNADLTLRVVPDGMDDDTALFAGDVAGTGYHAIYGDSAHPDPLEPGAAVAVLGLGPVGLSAVQFAVASGAGAVVAVDSVAERLQVAEAFGAIPVHLTEEDPRATVKSLTGGRGVDLAVDAVGDPRALEMAIRLLRKCGTLSIPGVYAERAEVHMGLLWIKALNVRSGHANVIGHVDRVISMLEAGVIDPAPLVTHHMGLDDAAEAYAIYDRREALKIVLTP